MDRLLGKLQDTFEEYFSHWDIHLPKRDVIERRRGSIHKAGWFINYLFGEEGGVEYLEFYCGHRMTNDRHHKIFESGEIISLDAPLDSYIVGHEEEYQRHNEKAYKELHDKGLL